MTSTGSGPIPIPAEAPLHVNTLRILGLSKTRESFLQSVISDIFTATNTEQVLKSVKAAAGRLQRHDIFEEIKIYLNSPSNMDDTVDVTFDLKEKPRGFLSTTFGVGENEATLNGAVSMRNLFGGAETATATYQFGNRTKAAVEGSLAVPIKGSPDIRAEAFVNGCIKDYSMINHYQENVKTAGIRFKGVSAYGQHEVGYGLSQREITALPNSSATVRAHSGPNTKSSVFHTFVSDSRDSASMPTGGKYFGVSHEIAGIGQHGDASFVKQQIEAHIHQTVVKADNKGTPQIVLNAGAKAGFLLPLGEDKQVNVSDRFYVGGPLSVRGFKMGGIGPREGNDSLGGNLFYAAGVSLTSSIPGAPDLPIKAHAFFNAGSILQTKKDAAPNDVLGELINSSRTAAGFGLIFHHDVGRIEANFCIPLKFQIGDLPKPGLQFGLGINFL